MKSPPQDEYRAGRNFSRMNPSHRRTRTEFLHECNVQLKSPAICADESYPLHTAAFDQERGRTLDTSGNYGNTAHRVSSWRENVRQEQRYAISLAFATCAQSLLAMLLAATCSAFPLHP
jgi:hypothetical protein